MKRSSPKVAGNVDTAFEVGDVVMITVEFRTTTIDVPLLPFLDEGVVTQSADARVENVPTAAVGGVHMTVGRLAGRREERGAVAVMFAVLMSSLLMLLAAIAVDLGMARSSKLSVQTSVDVSAISAGALLPATTATEEALLYQEVAT